ncbi:hypothetical protein OZX73_06150 [Bifidobacterium sp. ESL0775]|uniref:hypothetical protein n=1 Tax=Bifidobacterium sp. ESL0775 TaxID=2983230 RepID=UPI0023F81926|nr:hypothetical protein [Bifidobacterium sp. ESL0775]WEV68866.1 hypothetical protein OZX73_06150 [Bifidobacterium sp. ESL0775]
MKSRIWLRIAILFTQVSLLCMVAWGAFLIYGTIPRVLVNWPLLAGMKPLANISVVVGGVLLGVVIVSTLNLLYDALVLDDDARQLWQLRFLRSIIGFAEIYMLVTFFLFWTFARLMSFGIYIAVFLVAVTEIAAIWMLSEFIHIISSRVGNDGIWKLDLKG